jgi:hypothetical protein
MAGLLLTLDPVGHRRDARVAQAVLLQVQLLVEMRVHTCAYVSGEGEGGVLFVGWRTNMWLH